MGLLWQSKKTLAAANAASIAALQSPGAGAITLTANPVTLDTPRRVIITSGGNDTGITFTITGTNQTGNVISETFAGASAAAASSSLDYATVKSITHTGTVAGTLTAGTSTTGSTPWFSVNPHISPVNVSFAGVVSGSVTYQVDYTYDQIDAPFTGTTPTIWNPTGYTALAASKDGVITQPILFLRFTITAGAGTLYCQILQASITGN